MAGSFRGSTNRGTSRNTPFRQDVGKTGFLESQAAHGFVNVNPRGPTRLGPPGFGPSNPRSGFNDPSSTRQAPPGKGESSAPAGGGFLNLLFKKIFGDDDNRSDPNAPPPTDSGIPPVIPDAPDQGVDPNAPPDPASPGSRVPRGAIGLILGKLLSDARSRNGGTVATDGSFNFTDFNLPGSEQTDEVLQNLLEILQSDGATDPRLLNRQIVSVERGTEARQADQLSQFAAAGPGIQQSGIAQALLAAIGQGGENRIAGIHANEARLQEERKRRDLALINPLLAVSNDLTRTFTNARLTRRGQDRSRDADIARALGEFFRIGLNNDPTSGVPGSSSSPFDFPGPGPI